MKHNTIRVLLMTLFILYLVSFFHLKAIPMFFWATGFKRQIPFWAIQFFLVGYTCVYKHILFKKQLKFYVFFILLNFVTCLLFRGQSIDVSYSAWFPMFLIFYYPFFKSLNMSVKEWEQVLFNLFILLLIGYSIQYLFLSKEIFRVDTGFDRLEVEARVRIYSDAVLTLGALYCLNKFFNGHKKYIIFYLWTSVIVFMQSFRMIMLMYIVVSIIMYIKIVGLNRKLVLTIPIVVLLVTIFSRQQFVKDKIEELTTRGEVQSLDNPDYVRVLCFDHYMNNHFVNGWEMFLGSGRTENITNPSMLKEARSQYSKYVSKLGIDYHYYANDWGLIGLLWEAGFPFMVVFIWLIISIIRLKVPSPYLYIGMWELFLLLIGGTNEEIYYHENMIYQALSLVILDKVKTDEGRKVLTQKA